MREHANLPPMMRFVRNHVAEHLRPGRPWTSPSVSTKLLHTTFAITQRFGKHHFAETGAPCQCRTSLAWRTARAVELWGNSQVRRGEPDPLRADIVHVREDRRNRADFAGRLGFPDGSIKILDKNLVQALISPKDPDRGLSKLRVNLASAHRHSLILLELGFLQAACSAGLQSGCRAGVPARTHLAPYYAGGGVTEPVELPAGVVSAPVCFVKSKLHGRPRMPAPSSRLPVPDVSVNVASM